jgi:hypothetical protein
MTAIMTTRAEPQERTGRLTYVRHTQCESDPRSTADHDVVRRVADYAAGYADAKAEKGSRG